MQSLAPKTRPRDTIGKEAARLATAAARAVLWRKLRRESGVVVVEREMLVFMGKFFRMDVKWIGPIKPINEAALRTCRSLTAEVRLQVRGVLPVPT
jgi:hypothetical protein